MSTYEYSNLELQISPNCCEKGISKFDEDLCSKWDSAMKAGYFRYNLSEVKTKVLPGPHQYVALLNVKRATDRRPAEAMQGLNQPFNNAKFNFNKVQREEILLQLINQDENATYNDKIIINVSPADYGHSLIVPQIDKNLNQNLSEHGIKLAMDIMCLSGCRSFRIGFNSLCAHASVNHQHLHCYYTDQSLPAERLTATQISEHMHILDSDSPTGYGFELRHPADIPKLSRLLFSCTDYMRRSEVAHAVFITRGSSFTDPSTTVIRIFLWPRKKLLGPKPSENAFNSAVLEMAGHLLVKDVTYYETITDDSAYQCLKDTSLPPSEFDELTKTLLSIKSEL